MGSTRLVPDLPGGERGRHRRGHPEVATDAPDAAPLVSVDAPAISVTPALLPTSGGEVDLYPLIPSPSGSQSREDIERAISGLSEVAVIERWTGADWESVDKVDVGVGSDELARSTVIPALAEGAYRIVREGDESDHVGHFWVDDAIEAVGSSPA